MGGPSLCPPVPECCVRRAWPRTVLAHSPSTIAPNNGNKKKMKLTAITACALLLTACTTPVAYTDKPMEQYDKNTNYTVEDNPGGFTVSIYYSRYQFIPESEAVRLGTISLAAALSTSSREMNCRLDADGKTPRTRTFTKSLSSPKSSTHCAS